MQISQAFTLSQQREAVNYLTYFLRIITVFWHQLLNFFSAFLGIATFKSLIPKSRKCSFVKFMQEESVFFFLNFIFAILHRQFSIIIFATNASDTLMHIDESFFYNSCASLSALGPWQIQVISDSSSNLNLCYHKIKNVFF